MPFNNNNIVYHKKVINSIIKNTENELNQRLIKPGEDGSEFLCLTLAIKSSPTKNIKKIIAPRID